jgi:hypothetical protein
MEVWDRRRDGAGGRKEVWDRQRDGAGGRIEVWDRWRDHAGGRMEVWYSWKDGAGGRMHCKTAESHEPHKFTKMQSGPMTNVISPNSMEIRVL